MKTLRTLSGPSASAHSFVTVAESRPPLSPTTAPLHPVRCTVVRMNETRASASSLVTCGILDDIPSGNRVLRI